MIRNEKTGRFESEKIEMSDEQKEAICYKSKLLNKYFDTYDEMLKAEAKYKAEHDAELQAKELKKTAAEAVKTAITERVNAELAARDTKKEAYKVYLAACEEADKKVSEAKEKESEYLKEFCTKYGAFHDTITIGDITYTCDYAVNSWVDPFERLLHLHF